VNVPEQRRGCERRRLSCDAVDRQAVRFFFNGLPRRRREAVRDHLADCPRCRCKLEVFAAVWLRAGRRGKDGS
jgi:hypothetical protein